MAIPELLNVTHSVDLTVNRMDDKVNRVDEKVMVLIDGGKFSFPRLSALLDVHIARCQRNKRSHTEVCDHRR